MHVVVADPMQVRLGAQLRELAGPGLTWEFLTPGQSIADASDSPEVFVGSKLSADELPPAADLQLVQVAGAGYEGIDLHALPAGARVANTSHHGRAIAEYCVMSMLALSRDLIREDRALRTGRWLSVFQDPGSPVHETLEGRTVGILGMGEIGEHVAILATALGMRVVGIRRHPERPTAVPVAWMGGTDDIDTLLTLSDFVVVTTPLSEHTRGLIGARELALLAPHAVLINVARGPIVDEQALFDALRNGAIRGAAIDVWWQYPEQGNLRSPSRLPFGELDNVILTPHTSGVTSDVFHRRMKDVARNIAALRDGGELRNIVYESPIHPNPIESR
ncbi:2-hydroxyacid dehydrogenase [Herbiconiux ginsengi]|uniref:Phosphoglycerate dehydrogenase n=1 Tax=Herbiconiux ginsengi TaxID=381665 RepID=A0A1H3LHI8_9MICO|nr:2-hydroxyacid dehydrogenase [Herbiconiux ginsengi]SDY63997.1 Phosphoglycerate dehydrogenase [Herbiconiux ginsengi]